LSGPGRLKQPGVSSPIPATPHPRRVVMITGGSSGIGRCTARVFARRGWNVGLIARGAAGLAAAAEDVRLEGSVSAVAVADVADNAALERAAEQIVAALGPPDAWINAAGNGVYGRLLDVPEDEYRRVTDVTYMGTVNGTRTALRRMLPRDHGTIINVCSGVAFHGLPLMTSYAGAKAAVRGFSQSVRVELKLAKSRVHVCTVFPPAVNTPFFSHAPSHMGFPSRPVPPVYQPEIVAQALYLAATGRRREMTISSIVAVFALVSRVSPSLAAFLTEQLQFEKMLSRDPAANACEEPSLFAPPGRVLGVHGPFGSRARGWSAQVWLLGACQTLFRHGSLFRRAAAAAPPAPRLLSEPARAARDPAPGGSDVQGGVASGTSR
jgi:short-subunit dehydrogenase